jgi:hypothetical protein
MTNWKRRGERGRGYAQHCHPRIDGWRWRIQDVFRQADPEYRAKATSGNARDRYMENRKPRSTRLPRKVGLSASKSSSDALET